MGIASDILNPIGPSWLAKVWGFERTAQAQALFSYTPIVYRLIAEHEPDPRLSECLGSDIRIAHLSGLVGARERGSSISACREAATLFYELGRIIGSNR